MYPLYNVYDVLDKLATFQDSFIVMGSWNKYFLGNTFIVDFVSTSLWFSRNNKINQFDETNCHINCLAFSLFTTKYIIVDKGFSMSM